MINLKTPQEIELMRRAGHALAEVLDELRTTVRVGMTTGELDKIADRLIRERGAKPGFLGYNGFPRSICISVNDEVVHGIPGKRRIESGDVVSLDMGLVLDGFWADAGATVAVGKVDRETERLIRVTEEALYVAVEEARPGHRVGDISHAVQRHAEGAGFSVVKQFVGHGIGRRMHEDPQVPNYGVAGTGPELKVGMTLALEPMVNAGTDEVFVKPDNWTVVTADGALSAYFEHTVAVTPAGPMILTSLPGAEKARLKSA